MYLHGGKHLSRDGTRVSSLFSKVLTSLWDVGQPQSNNGCIAFKHMKLVTTPCQSGSYYNISTDGDPSLTQKPLLGYLCETRIMTTASGSDTCFFPFNYQGKTYTTCSYENNSLLNNNGLPWCMTDVS